jgi:ADP-ribose diphosphatase
MLFRTRSRSTCKEDFMKYEAMIPRGKITTNDPYFTLMEDAQGVGFIHCSDAVLVIPLTEDGQVLLAQERSPAFDREILTLVSGQVETGEALEEAANRELQEELGWRAQRLDYLGELHPFKYLTTRQFVFLARELTPSKLPGDEKHTITARPVSLNEFVAWCRQDKLHDALAVAALCLAHHFLQGEMK